MCRICIAGMPPLFFGNHCIRSTASTASKKLSKIILLFHHFLGQPSLVRCHGCSQPGQDSKTLRSWSVTAKTAAIIMHLGITGGFTETWEVSCEKQAPIICTSKSHWILYQFQSLSTALVSLAPSKKKKGGNNDRPISLSHRIIPFRPTVASHHHRGPHLAVNWIQSPSSRQVHWKGPRPQ